MSRRKYRETAKKIQEVIGRRAVDQLAKQSGLVERKRKVTGFRLLSALIAKVGSGMVEAIADIHREFNRAVDDEVRYKPFHNRLAQEEFPRFMKRVFCDMMSSLLAEALEAIPDRIASKWLDFWIQDGTSFALHDGLKEAFSNRFTAIRPSGVELHVTLSLLRNQPVRVSVAPDSEGERQFLPAPEALKSMLLLIDRGYQSIAYCTSLRKAGADFIARFRSDVNPTILKARTKNQALSQVLEGEKLKDVDEWLHGRHMDLDVEFSGGEKFRLVLKWNNEKACHMILATNVDSETCTGSLIRQLYSLRWQVELLFKEWKSYSNLKGLTTRKPEIAEGLIWASLCAAYLKRFLAHKAQHVHEVSTSTQIAAKALGVMLPRLIDALQRKNSWGFITRIGEVLRFLAKNARRTNRQRERNSGRLSVGLQPAFSCRAAP